MHACWHAWGGLQTQNRRSSKKSNFPWAGEGRRDILRRAAIDLILAEEVQGEKWQIDNSLVYLRKIVFSVYVLPHAKMQVSCGDLGERS
jgi:hypothetical protein